MPIRPGTLEQVLSGRDRSTRARLVRWVCSAVEPAYAAIVARRNRKFDAGKGVERAAVPVVSIGNLTTGGTGKTPLVAQVASDLRSAGLRPAILTRGYKARAGESDEAMLLRDLLQESGSRPVRVLVNPDRVAGARAALAQDPEVNVLVLDDGFQHRRLARDADVVVMDMTNPWGFERLIPRGLLREPVASLARASAIVFTRCDLVDPAAVDRVEQRVLELAPCAEIVRCAEEWSGLVETVHGSDVALPLESLRGLRVVLFCGVGNPQAVVRSALRYHAELAAQRFYPDHHDYSTEDLESLVGLAIASDAQVLLTTEKDYVKLRRLSPRARVLRPRHGLRFELDGRERLLRSILSSIGRTETPANTPAE
jgi:tetraacyldisaccharide 4'-kinase